MNEEHGLFIDNGAGMCIVDAETSRQDKLIDDCS